MAGPQLQGGVISSEVGFDVSGILSAGTLTGEVHPQIFPYESYGFISAPTFISDLFNLGITGNTTTIVTVGPTYTYLLRGWYSLNNKYEYWTGNSVNAPNPNSHTYPEVTIEACN